MRPFDDSLMRLGLPADVEAERWVLGLALRNPAANFPAVNGTLEASDFSVQSHQLVFQRMAEMDAAGSHIDSAMLARELHKRGELETVGGLSYLIGLSDGMPDLPSCDAYVQSVKEKSLRRQAILAMEEAKARLCDPGGGLDQIQEAQSVLQRIGTSAVRPAGLRFVREIIEEQGFMEPQTQERGISTPWPGVDRLTGGLRPGQLIVWAARPAVGKTTAAVQIGIHAAEAGIGTALFSLEMTGRLILRRLLAGRAGIDLSAWNYGRLDASERGRVAKEAWHVRKLPFSIYDQANATVPAIRAALLRATAEGSIGLVIVDYLQLLGAARGRIANNRNDEVAEISRGLKLLAMELEVPVLALSQLTRGNERENRPPRLSDLRDSGAIEQDADIVAFLHRPGERGAGDQVDLRIEKNRAGMVGKVELLMEGSRARFSQLGVEAEEGDQLALTEQYA
jgi:replicative DNA helicase